MFPNYNPLAGRDEETPYDYDHIVPWADWGKPAYRSARKPFKEFCEDDPSTIGNSIGNFRIENSSANRSDGDLSPAEKLKLNNTDLLDTQEILERSSIVSSEVLFWKKCSHDSQGCWDECRALAFQNAVEMRAFRLFEQYFNEGCFEKWMPQISANSGPYL